MPCREGRRINKADYDIVIVGGGIVGSATLYALSQTGQRVLLLQAGRIGDGATIANGGLITSSMSDPWNSPYVTSQLIRALLPGETAIKLDLRRLPKMASWGASFL